MIAPRSPQSLAFGDESSATLSVSVQSQITKVGLKRRSGRKIWAGGQEIKMAKMMDDAKKGKSEWGDDVELNWPLSWEWCAQLEERGWAIMVMPGDGVDAASSSEDGAAGDVVVLLKEAILMKQDKCEGGWAASKKEWRQLTQKFVVVGEKSGSGQGDEKRFK